MTTRRMAATVVLAITVLGGATAGTGESLGSAALSVGNRANNPVSASLRAARERNGRPGQYAPVRGV